LTDRPKNVLYKVTLGQLNYNTYNTGMPHTFLYS